MTSDPRFLCPCGAPAPGALPRPGAPPIDCTRCGSPLVQPGRVPPAALEWGLAAGVLAGAAAAYGWMLVPRLAAPAAERGWTFVVSAVEGGAPWWICLGALVVAWAVRLAARVRSPGLQWIAVLAFVVFLCIGEVLLYRHGIRDRLIAMHAAEGVADPEIRGDEEFQSMTFLKYLRIEVGLAWCGAVAIGTWIQSFVLRPVPAVAAFVVPESPELAPPPHGDTQSVEPAESMPPAATA